MERVLVEVTDPTTKVETKEEMESGRDGVVGKVLGGIVYSSIFFDDGGSEYGGEGDGVEGRGKVWISSCAKINDAF